MGRFSPEATPSPPSVRSDFDDDNGMTMTLLRMMMMEMLALPMRCILHTLTLCHS